MPVPHHITPRNSLVLVRLFLKPEERVGNITVPTNKNEYTEAEVLAVGPDTIGAAGGQSTTRDLRPGQRVLVKHKRKVERMGPMGQIQAAYYNEGIPLRGTKDDDGSEVFLFEQSSIIAIIN